MEQASSISETDGSDDDPIVKEIPIIHSKRLEENLYLFQYPLKRKACTNEMVIKKCLFKPQNQEVKLEMAIDVDSPNFDTGRAEKIANEVDGSIDPHKNDNKSVHFENEIVDKVVLSSSLSVKQPRKYAVAAFNGKEIHLTSLKGIFQFRPTFDYLDKSLKKKKQAETPNDLSDEEEAGPSNAQQVTVRFKSNDERWRKASENSFKALQAKSAGEPWTECVWYDRESTLSSVERLKLISENLDDIGQAQNLSDVEYIRLLVPEDQEQATMEPTLPSNVLSLHALRALPLQEQCRLLLKDAQIIQFQQLLMLLAGGEGLTAETLLKTLQKVAVLVRGNWIVKSEVLYPANSFSATSGVPAELMCRARDYVLYLFTKNQYVERKKVSSVMKIPAEEVKEIFTGISMLRHNKGWELTLPTDQDFINRHSDIVQRQNQLWELTYKNLSEFLKDNKEKQQRRKSKSVSEDSKVKNGLTCASSDESGTEKNKSPIAARKNKSIKIKNELNS